ncbi:MAG: hypothetical protein EXS10_01545 [Phycisphaerales bacterium]|nr:hypothetical protein [Phycisphaerales bacterium]
MTAHSKTFLDHAPYGILVDAIERWAVAAQSLRESLTESAIARKSDGSIVTAVDVAIQALALDLLASIDDAPALAEETADSLHALAGGLGVVMEVLRALEPTSRITEQSFLPSLVQRIARGTEDRFWILDPIDGTRSFVRGGHWCVCLALVEQGALEFAVNALPTVEHGVTQAAVRGRGSFERPISIREKSDWKRLQSRDSMQMTVRVASAPSSNARSAWRARVLACAASRDMRVDWVDAESQAKYALVARGDADLVLTPQSAGGAALWDHAGGALIAVEAGARAMSFDGSAIAWNVGRDVGMKGGLAVGTSRALPLAESLATNAAEQST